MIGSTTIVLPAGDGGRPLLQAADAVLRSARAPVRTLIPVSSRHPLPPLVDSVAARLNAAIVAEGESTAGALNACARMADSTYVLFLRPGCMLDASCLEQCESAFARDASVAAVAPSIRLQTPDSTAHLDSAPAATTAAAVLNDTRGVPPVFALRRDVWEALGGFDETFAELAEYEFWLRLTLARHTVAVLAEPLIARDITSSAAPVGRDFMSRQLSGMDTGHLRMFRAVLEKHAGAIEQIMTDLLVAREVRFGQLREAHRALLAQRDAGLADLDRLRAEAAHLRAYVAHHGRDEIDWGDLRRSDPISREWGYDRGVPIDRRYIDEFLSAHSSDVHGSVLEVQEDAFTRAYGGARVTASSVLDIDASNPRATVLADLRCAPGIPAEQYDCVILTQTLHVIDDMGAALRECYRMLKPDGVLLATMPASSRVCLEYGHDGDFWRATPAGARALFRTAFFPATVATSAFGNVLTNVAFLHGVATAEVSDAEFDARDPYFPALTGIRARKGSRSTARAARGVVLLYHRVEEAAGVLDLSVPPALFDAQLAWLREECEVVPLDTLLESPPESLPARAVALTFDDGYADHLTTVAPMLRKHDLPATFFLTTRWLTEQGEYWWDVLERVPLAEAERARVHDRLVHATLAEREAIVGELARREGAGAPRVRPMTADEVRQLADDPRVTIGAHSVNHLAFPNQSAAAVQREIDESCTVLARVVGKPVDLFAYPYGAYDRASAGAVRASCRWGMSCDQRPLTESFDAAAVPRLEVKRWNVQELAARLRSDFEI